MRQRQTKAFRISLRFLQILTNFDDHRSCALLNAALTTILHDKLITALCCLTDDTTYGVTPSLKMVDHCYQKTKNSTFR